MAATLQFRARRGILVALDAESIDSCKRVVEKTQSVSGVVGYKLGLTSVLRIGLFETVRQFKEVTNLPLIYDHQKAGPDVFDMAGKFASLCALAKVDGLILFPIAGPRSVDSFVGETLKRELLPIVGGDLPFPDYNASGGGYVIDQALERIIDRSIGLGVTCFVVPGHTPEKLRSLGPRVLSKVSDPVFITPGIGPLGGRIEDLVRIVPQASVIGVVGRAVYDAEDPRKAAEELCDAAQNAD